MWLILQKIYFSIKVLHCYYPIVLIPWSRPCLWNIHINPVPTQIFVCPLRRDPFLIIFPFGFCLFTVESLATFQLILCHRCQNRRVMPRRHVKKRRKLGGKISCAFTFPWQRCGLRCAIFMRQLAANNLPFECGPMCPMCSTCCIFERRRRRRR